VEFTQVKLAQDGRVATLTLARPERLNAITPTLLAEGCAALESVAASENVSVLVLTGEGRAFSAGVDLKVLSAPGFARGEGRDFNERAARFTRLLETIPQATIARVQGPCFTGGLELAVACDLLVAADEAVFADTHAKLGFRPTFGLTQRLPRRIGAMRAMELSFTARRFGGQEAAAIGLALVSVPLAQLDATVAGLAGQIAENSLGSIGAYKQLYRASANLGLDAGLVHERTAQIEIKDRAERQAAMVASLGKRGA
jgi:enoyl-CoA hydratase/carnithine racemase